MKSFFYFLFLITSIHSLYAQLPTNDQLNSDSLLIVLKEGKNDSIKARAAFHLSKIWINNDSAKGIQYLNLGKELAHNDEFLQAIYRYQTIKSYSNKNQVDSILAIFQKYQHSDSWDYTYRLYINRVIWLINQQESDEALKLLQNKVLPLVYKLKNKGYQAEVYLEMGRAFINRNMPDKSIEYLKKAIALYESIQPKDQYIIYSLIHSLVALANVYNTLEINNEVASVIDRAKELLAIAPNTAQQLRVTNVEATHLVQTKQYNSAEKLIKNTLSNSKGIPEKYLLNLYFQSHKAKAAMGDHQGALQILKTSHPIDSVLLNRNKFGAIDLSKLLPAYATAYENVNDYKKASFYWKRYINHRDSINKDDVAIQVSKLEVQLRTQEKDAVIHNLESEKREASLRLKNQHIWNGMIASVAFFLLTLLGFIIYIYKNKQKENTNRILQIETDNKLEIAKALLEGEERERQRIGRDLHDGLGGTLAGIRIQLSSSQQKQKAPDVNQAILQLEDSIAEVRRIARNMIPESLIVNGLDTALQDLCVAFSAANLHIEYQSYLLSDNISSSVQTNIYRIVQELLTNACRHSHAQNIIVQCLQNEDVILLTVEDDGQGFEMADIHQISGIGLKNIQRRVEYIQGKINIESKPKEGTTINIEIHT